MDSPENLIFGLDLPVLLALVGSLSVLIVGAVVFAVLLKRDLSSKRKVHGLSGAAEIDAEATRDYQVRCVLTFFVEPLPPICGSFYLCTYLFSVMCLLSNKLL